MTSIDVKAKRVLFILPLIKFHANPFSNSYVAFGRTDGQAGRQTGTNVVKVFRSMGCFVVSPMSILISWTYAFMAEHGWHQNKTAAINNESVNIDTLHRPVIIQPPCRHVILDTRRSGQQWRHQHTAPCPRGIRLTKQTYYCLRRLSLHQLPYCLTWSSG